MNRLHRLTVGLLGLLGLLVFATTLFQIPARAQSSPKVSITTIVTVLGPKFTAAPEIAKEDVVVFSGKTRLDVTDWVPAQGQNGGLQLAVLIDNSTNRFGVGTQLNEVADFIAQQPEGTEVGVFYAVSGTVQAASPFSRDYGAAGKTLRSPTSPRADNSPSVYMSLSDLVNHKWQPTGGRREILLISSGADGMNRGPESPYVQAAIEDTQKAGVVVYAMYTFGGGIDQSMSGQYAQSNLKELAESSGGYNLFEGNTTPMSYVSYLKLLDAALRHQYRLTFTIEPKYKAKGELREIKIRTEQHHVDFKYSKMVFVPGTAR
jgi:hypothetical protein